MQKALIRRVWQRARACCEYCQMPQAHYRVAFEIDHISAEQHGGRTFAGNLALACARCNGRKGPNIAGWDRANRQIVRLFHPRRDAWSDHFRWRGAYLLGRTPIGRATIAVLGINDPLYVAVRKALLAEDAFPPQHLKG